tara:strand:- start:502 stop:654 length:153 start_codon:yes stop_codon:yes gene_type:complete
MFLDAFWSALGVFAALVAVLFAAFSMFFTLFFINLNWPKIKRMFFFLCSW